MDADKELGIGLGFLGLIIVFLCAYVAWNVKVKKNKMRRVAEEDRELVRSGKMTEEDLSKKIQSMVPSLISACSILAGITIAAMFIIIAQIVFERVHFQGMQQGIVLTVLFLSAVSAGCWLLALEQFTHMSAPSIDFKRLMKFERYTYNLWIIGIALMLIGIYLFLLLTNLYVAMAAGFATLLIVIGYLKIHNDW